MTEPMVTLANRPLTAVLGLCYSSAMTEQTSENDSQAYNWWALNMSMRSVLDIDDYDELRDYRG